MEGDVAEDLRPHSISQPYILEADHVTTLWATRPCCFGAECLSCRRLGPSDGVVNDGLISRAPAVAGASFGREALTISIYPGKRLSEGGRSRMPDERNARPVSGEIMAAPLAGTEPGEPAPRPSSMPMSSMPSSRRSGRTSRPRRRMPGNRRRSARPPLPSRGSRFAAQGRCRAAGRKGRCAAGRCSGSSVSASQPARSGFRAAMRWSGRRRSPAEAEPAQSIVNALHIVDVTSRVEEHGGRPVLFVDGKAVNDDRDRAHAAAARDRRDGQ